MPPSLQVPSSIRLPASIVFLLSISRFPSNRTVRRRGSRREAVGDGPGEAWLRSLHPRCRIPLQPGAPGWVAHRLQLVGNGLRGGGVLQQPRHRQLPVQQHGESCCRSQAGYHVHDISVVQDTAIFFAAGNTGQSGARSLTMQASGKNSITVGSR
jgi:hypothetical protein